MSNTVKLITCPKCGIPIPEGAPQGLCPKCVLVVAATVNDAPISPTAPSEIPSIERVAAAFPQLEIVELIGWGGMGFVFKARQPRLDRFVALKLLPDKLARDPRFAERFNREGKVLARLNHANIVSVYDFGMTEHFYFLVMEFVDGVNLREAMQIGRFSPAEALLVVPKICEALQYAHGQGILHRDIKPANILLDSRGQVKIADFGIAKLVGEEKADITLTATGAALGTPQYMAPEQLENPSEVDHRADIYSLGVVFYEMLTGELPIGRFAAPSSKTPVGSNVDEVVFRTLEKDRERRYQSAGEMKAEVEHLGKGENAGITSQTKKQGRSLWPVLKWVSIGLVFVVAGLGIARRASLFRNSPSMPERTGEVLASQWLKAPESPNTTNAIRFTITNVELHQDKGTKWVAMDYAADVRGDCEEVFYTDGKDLVTRKIGLLVTPKDSPQVLRQRFEWQMPAGAHEGVVSVLVNEFARVLVGKSFLVPEGEQRPLLRCPVGMVDTVNIGIGTRHRDSFLAE
jgi:tRNA A-37 threonylcarbamoyl transferase component Bud32